MVTKSYIGKNLKVCNRLYIESTSVQKGLFYSKLAILELCGWIEMSMDDIALRTATRLIRNPQHIKFFKQEIVARISGFDYEQHFRRMLMAIIGLRGVAQMEKAVNQSKFQPMCGALNTLRLYRNKHAHEYIKGTTLVLDAPSLTISRFQTIYSGLTDVERVLRSMR